MLEKLDAWLLNTLYQPLSNWWMWRVGKSNFWLAKMSLWIFLICMTTLQFLREFNAFMLLLYIAMGFLILSEISRCEHNDNNTQCGSANAERLNPMRPTFLIFWLVFVVIDVVNLIVSKSLIGLLELGLDIAFISGMYFAACDRPPPQPARESRRAFAEA